MPHDHPVVYLIRHGEKPPKVNGKDVVGLSDDGEIRAQGLVKVFGSDSGYDIGLILAQDYDHKDGDRDRPYQTIKPLAESLSPYVELNTSIHRGDAPGVVKAIKKYSGPGNVLICWEHKHLQDIAEALGVKHAEPYPDKRFDLIWTVKHPYHEISSVTSEHILPMDKDHADSP